jgi:hypothetical protein
VPAIRIPNKSAEPLAVDVHLEEPEQAPSAAAEQAERSSPAEQEHPEVRCPVRSSFGDAAAPDHAPAPNGNAGTAGRQAPSQAPQQQQQQQRREPQQQHQRPQPLDIPGASSGAYHQQRQQGTFTVGSPTVTAPIVPQIRRTLSGGAHAAGPRAP